jgi:hypothetical protein
LYGGAVTVLPVVLRALLPVVCWCLLLFTTILSVYVVVVLNGDVHLNSLRLVICYVYGFVRLVMLLITVMPLLLLLLLLFVVYIYYHSHCRYGIVVIVGITIHSFTRLPTVVDFTALSRCCCYLLLNVVVDLRWLIPLLLLLLPFP